MPRMTEPAQQVRLAAPNEFLGDRMKGQASLNSCKLYINLAPHQFINDTAKIMWAFSYMKSNQAARFMDKQMWSYQTVSGLPYTDWQDFIAEFTAEFCLKNEVQMARMELETP
jgi:hypothetical protein